MPIRFRCAYCNQLMAIATRKAATVVRCPKCSGQVVVPTPEDGPDEPGGPEVPEPASAKNGGLFEESDFEKVFQGPEPQAPAAGAPPRPQPRPVAPVPAPQAPRPAPRREAPAAESASAPRGIFLTPGLLTILCILLAVLLGMAFFVGMLVGRGG